MSCPRVGLLATLCVVSACTANDASRGNQPAAPSLVRLAATDYAFDAPDTIAAGFTTFRLTNQGDQLHMAQLVKLEDGKTLDDFLVEYDEAFRTKGPRPAWAPRIGGPGVAEPGRSSNATHQLEPGNYAWICLMNVPDGIPHVVKARMAKPFTVKARGDSAVGRAPRASIVIRLLDYSFSVSAPLTAGHHVIHVENVGAEPHEVGLIRLAVGKTAEDFEMWLKNPQGPPPGSSVGGLSSFAPNRDGYFEVELASGDYMLFCLVTAPDGRSHADHGMIHHVHVA